MADQASQGATGNKVVRKRFDVDRHPFLIKAIKVLTWLVSAIVPLILFINIHGIVDGTPEGRGRSGGRSADFVRAKIVLTADERAFLNKEYDNATSEIRMRLEHEHTMIALKFTLVGAVLGFILYANELGAKASEGTVRSTWMAVCCWAAVVVSGIVDLRRQLNVDVIVQLGTWVREVEGRFLSRPVGWEQFITPPVSETGADGLARPVVINDDVRAPSTFWHSPLYPLLRLEREFVTWALYLLALTIFVRQGADKSEGSNRGNVDETTRIAFIFSTVCLLLFGLYSLHFWYEDPRGALKYVGSLVLIGLVSVWSWIWIKARESQISATHL